MVPTLAPGLLRFLNDRAGGDVLTFWLADPPGASGCESEGSRLAKVFDRCPLVWDIVSEPCAGIFKVNLPVIGGTDAPIFNLMRGISRVPSTWGFGTSFLASATRFQK